MPDHAAPPDPRYLAAALASVFCSRLEEEASARGVRVSSARIRRIGRWLVAGDEEIPFPAKAHEASPVPGGAVEALDYLHLVPEEVRKSLGQHVTPKPIVRYILQAAGYREDGALLGTRLCDPACGSGAFLVEVVQICLRAFEKAGVPPEAQYPRVCEHLTGIDIDPLACLFARFNLALLLAPVLLVWLEAHPRRLPPLLPIHRRDTLSELAAELGGEGLFQVRGSRALLRDAFDYVVGNPPYRKLTELSAPMRAAFQGSIYGHPNAYGVFLHAGVELMKPGGKLGFIVPRSMLSGLYFQNLRRVLEHRTHLEEVTILADRRKVFAKVLQGTMIIVARKRRDDGERKPDSPMRAAVVRRVAALEVDGPRHLLVPESRVVRRLNGTTVWFVSDRERSYSILDKLLGRHPLLNSPAVACAAKTGPIVWNRVKSGLRERRGPGALPLVWATDVGRFRFRFGTAAESRPAYLEESPKTSSLTNRGPCLLVQRVTADEQARRIVASLAPFGPRQRYFVENHLNVLQPVAGEIDLRYLAGVLSSDVSEFLFRLMNGNTQVSATELNLLPIPRGPFEPLIAGVVEKLAEESEPASRADLEAELNDRVGRAFGLSKGDLGFLQRSLTVATGGQSSKEKEAECL